MKKKSVFEKFKNKRGKYVDKIKKIREENENKRSYESDDRFWAPTKGENGSAVAVIRFLPNKDPEKLFIVKTLSHFFRAKGNKKNGAGRWLHEVCPKTIKEKCPICEKNNQIGEGSYNDWTQSEKSEYRRRKAIKQYIANILVIKDPQKPENEGKIFLYKFGEKIYEKIINKMDPSDDERETGAEPVYVVDPWEGANFKIRTKLNNTGEYEFQDYSGCEWLTPKPIGTDEEIAEILGFDEEKEIFTKLYDVEEFIDPEKIKSYEELEKIFKDTMNSANVGRAEESISDDDFDNDNTDKTSEEDDDFDENSEEDDDFDLDDDDDLLDDLPDID